MTICNNLQQGIHNSVFWLIVLVSSRHLQTSSILRRPKKEQIQSEYFPNHQKHNYKWKLMLSVPSYMSFLFLISQQRLYISRGQMPKNKKSLKSVCWMCKRQLFANTFTKTKGPQAYLGLQKRDFFDEQIRKTQKLSHLVFELCRVEGGVFKYLSFRS